MFQNLNPIPIDPLFGIAQKFKEDPNPKKIDLCVGFFFDEEGNPFVTESVKKAIPKLQDENYNYHSMQGFKPFLESVGVLCLSKLFDQSLIASEQTCGGTHALWNFSELVHRSQGKQKILVGIPTWANHFGILKKHEFIQFSHLDNSREVSVKNYKQAIESAPKNSILLLQGGKSHNPVGKNLSIADLEKLIDPIREKNIFVFVDFAYLGFGEGLELDSQWVQYLWRNLDQMALGVSFSKNATLYRQRTGALYIKTKTTSQKEILEQNLQNIVRETVSNLPAFGAEIMAEILGDLKLLQLWKSEVEMMRKSINKRRNLLVAQLPDSFQHLKETSGMFGLLGLPESRVLELRERDSIYLPNDSRINFAGLKISDIDFLAERFAA